MNTVNKSSFAEKRMLLANTCHITQDTALIYGHSSALCPLFSVLSGCSVGQRIVSGTIENYNVVLSFPVKHSGPELVRRKIISYRNVHNS